MPEDLELIKKRSKPPRFTKGKGRSKYAKGFRHYDREPRDVKKSKSTPEQRKKIREHANKWRQPKLGDIWPKSTATD